MEHIVFFTFISENVGKHNEFEHVLIKKHENTMFFNFCYESVSFSWPGNPDAARCCQMLPDAARWCHMVPDGDFGSPSQTTG